MTNKNVGIIYRVIIVELMKEDHWFHKRNYAKETWNHGIKAWDFKNVIHMACMRIRNVVYEHLNYLNVIRG